MMLNNLYSLPETGFLRLTQIIGNPKANPPIPALIPISKSTLWAWVQKGRFPRPIKLSSKVTVWRVEDVLAMIRGDQVYPNNQSVINDCQRSYEWTG
jgi:prophage regulatory protein